MKKITLSFLMFFMVCHVIQAKPIDADFAKQIAINFYRYNASHVSTSIEAVLVKKYDARIERLDRQIPLIYIFNMNHNDGFVIVAGDDAVLPILGYSTSGKVDINDIPINMQKWMESYRAEILEIVEKNMLSDNRTQEQWQLYERFVPTFTVPRRAVAPLLTTQWDQSPYYNASCPNDATQGTRTVTGCVATAMAQVMKYWNHPAQGTGFHSYNHTRYGTLSANFGATTYNWASMPNRVTSANAAVATLMYHCGVSVNMNYGVVVSGTETLDVANALKTYFGYVNTLSGVRRRDYSEAQWITMLKTELNANRPVQYAGVGSGGGHSFVCDGYDNNDFFHFNWGWAGNSDGYFNVNDLRPSALGTGGGTGDYNASQRAIIGVQPNANTGGGTTPTSMKMNSNITITPNSIVYQQPFSAKANLVNRSTATFYGDITAALFDNNYNFVSHIKTLNETNGLRQNFTYLNGGLTFDNTGLQAPPGSYYIGIFVRPTGGEWSLAGNEGSNTNWLSVTITNPTSIELYGQLKTTPTTLVKNQPFTAWLDLANRSATPFNGIVSVDLHTINGTHIQQIASMSNIQLPVNSHFTNGLTFNSTGLNVEPGTYQVAAWVQRTGGNWELVGSTATYYNPIQVTVIAPALQPDLYEANNTETTCYAITPTFHNNLATISTNGSNMHTGNDYDYYRFNLPAGYNYSVTARVHDSDNSANGQTYTNDVAFSYRKRGVASWSDAFDVSSSAVSVSNGGYIDFWVSPFFLGNEGTYLLDIQITRSISNATNEFVDLPVQLYPNPVKDVLNIEWKQANYLPLESIEILDIFGRIVHREIEKIGMDNYVIPTNQLPDGTYNIVFRTQKGLCRKKFVIHH